MKDKSLIVFLIIIVFVISFIFITHKKEENRGNYDYLVLVNKYSELPSDWEKKVELVDAKNAWKEDIKVEKEAYKNYLKLKKALAKENVTILLDSVYRSVEEQQNIWDEWTNDPEKGIDYVKQYVAVPGYSEHHTGLAIDICIKKDGKLIYDNDKMIAERKIFAKIHKKLADYGFILRYLEGRDEITGYSYEPWHLRYIGDKKIAKEIMEKDITFEEYLGSIKNPKETPSAVQYQIETAVINLLKNAYGEKLSSYRFSNIKVYKDEEIENNKKLKKMKLNKNDIVFETTYQLLQLYSIDPEDFINQEGGEYDAELGWIVNIHKYGIMKQNEEGNYYLESFGPSF